MTRTEPALCTNAPTTGLNIPVIARVMAAKFRIIEKVRFHLIVVIILFESESKWGSSPTLSSTSAMSAASTAISLPIPPIAIPTSAIFNAGASFTPSPIMQTDFPFFRQPSIYCNLSSGRHPAYTSTIRSFLAICCAAFSLSPVSSTGSAPNCFIFSMVSILSFLSVSDKIM